MTFPIEYMYAIWLIITPLIVHKGQRVSAGIFVALCGVAFLFQLEVLEYLGKPTGFFSFMNSDVSLRGLIVWTLQTLFFIGISYISKATIGVVYFGATLSLYVFSIVISSVVLLL